MFVYVIVGIIGFGLLVAVHEAGHFLTAKLLDVQVNEFSIGMGPALFSQKRGETQYSLRLFPMGGYCAMEGEDEETGNPRSFASKAAWKKIIILAAGSVSNFVAGFLVVVVLFSVAGGYVVPVVQDFMDGFPCESEEGLLPGDRILSINGHKVSVYSDVSTALSMATGDTMDMTIRRNGEVLQRNDLPITLREYTLNGETVQRYGLYFGTEDATVLGVLGQSWDTCLYFSRAVWSGLAMLVRGDVALSDMSGPVGIVSYMGEAGTQADDISSGVQNVLYIIALIAVNLAIMNLLPIPALDGGRIFFLLVSGLIFVVTRRKVNPKYEAYLHAGGFALLILLMVVVTFSDIVKLVN